MLNLNSDLWFGSPASFKAAVDAEASIAQITKQRAGLPSDVKPLFQSVGPVAIVEIKGSLVNSDSPYLSMFGMSGYPAIRRSLVAAANDPEIKQVLLLVDSGGGAVSGAGDTADLIRRIDTKVKPVTAFASGTMASAAYWTGGSAGKVFSSPTAVVGSLGVLTTHMDYSAMLEKDGIKATVLRAGKYKALGNSVEPLTDEARAQIQEQLDAVYKVFLSHVAESRGVSYAVADSKMGQGRVFVGQAAVEAGLADGTATFDDLMSKLQSQKVVDKRIMSHDNSITIDRSKPVNQATLTDKDIAALAAGATAPAAEATETPKVAAGEVVADAKADPTTEVAAEKQPAAKEDGGVVAYLQSQVAAKDAAILALTVSKNDLTTKLEGIEASHKGLMEVAAKSVANMSIALGRSAPDASAMTGVQLLALHESTSADFTKNFKVGGVAAVAAAAPEKETKVQASVVKAKLAAVKIGSK